MACVEFDVSAHRGEITGVAFDEFAEALAIEEHRTGEAQALIALTGRMPDLGDAARMQQR
jgi:hypothetical protein